jgi:hypothetical protein
MITWFKNLIKKMFGPTESVTYMDDPVVYKDYVAEPAPVVEQVQELPAAVEPEPAVAPPVIEPVAEAAAEPVKVKKARKPAVRKAKVKAEASSVANVTDVTKKPRKKKS